MDNLSLTRWFIGPKFHSFSHSPKEQYETLFLKCAAVEAGLYCSFTIQGNYITRSVLSSTMTDEANFSEILWFSNSNFLHGWAEYRFKNHNLLHRQSCYCIFPVCIGHGPEPTFSPASAPPPSWPKAWACWLCHS